ncbi:MAG: response regulator, partial [Myxococcota bacterium]
ETLLLVEDEEPVRRTLKRILVRAGYEVLEAADAESAMALFAEASARIDAAILDAVLPDRSGLEVGAAIREARPDAPLILSTGYVDALDPKGHRGRLFDRVLAKPYPADELLGTLRELLDAAKASR